MANRRKRPRGRSGCEGDDDDGDYPFSAADTVDSDDEQGLELEEMDIEFGPYRRDNYGNGNLCDDDDGSGNVKKIEEVGNNGNNDKVGSSQAEGLGFPLLDPILTPDEKLEKLRAKYSVITEAAEIVVQTCIKIAGQMRLRTSGENFRHNGSSFSGSTWETTAFGGYVRPTLALVRRLDMTTDENCCSLFAHRLFLLAVYKYPRYSFAIALFLHSMCNDKPSSTSHRNFLIFTKLKELLLAVLYRQTVFDVILDPKQSKAMTNDDDDEESLTLKHLEQELPDTMKSITSDLHLLQKKIRARHLNAATFMAYLICSRTTSANSGEFLSQLLRRLSYQMEVNMNFRSVCRILTICSHLTHLNGSNLLYKCFSRISRFFDVVIQKCGDAEDWRRVARIHEDFEEVFLTSIIGQDFDKRKIQRQLLILNPNIPPPEIAIFTYQKHTNGSYSIYRQFSGQRPTLWKYFSADKAARDCCLVVAGIPEFDHEAQDQLDWETENSQENVGAVPVAVQVFSAEETRPNFVPSFSMTSEKLRKWWGKSQRKNRRSSAYFGQIEDNLDESCAGVGPISGAEVAENKAELEQEPCSSSETEAMDMDFVMDQIVGPKYFDLEQEQGQASGADAEGQGLGLDLDPKNSAIVACLDVDVEPVELISGTEAEDHLEEEEDDNFVDASDCSDEGMDYEDEESRNSESADSFEDAAMELELEDWN